MKDLIDRIHDTGGGRVDMINGRKFGKNYPQVIDGETVVMRSGEILRFACCDCGLVHNIAFSSDKKGNIGIAIERNNRSTSRLRKYREHDFTRR